MAKELILEIGTEEIPTGFMEPAFEHLRKSITEGLAAQGVAHGEVITTGTPRRLVCCVKGLADKTADVTEEILGPAKRIAFDEEGKPTKAAEGFARGNKAKVKDLKVVKTEKGEYICVRRTTKGKDVMPVLKELLPRVVDSIPFAKSMRWGDYDVRFARPVHWIVAVLGGKVIPFSYGTVKSGDRSRGHRFLARKEFKVTSYAKYLKDAKAHHIVVNHEERKATIRRQVSQLAKRHGGQVLEDEKLLEEVTFLVEEPSAVLGTFDKRFLRLPDEVLITSMRSHQRYFALVDGKGKLMPCFITVNNTKAKRPKEVARGNEYVLRARLADADFFYIEDQKKPLEHFVEALKEVIYQSKLGTSYEKVERFEKVANWLVEKVDGDKKARHVSRVAWLSKADLETQMVYEFPELQGHMGREYARLKGEPKEVYQGVYEHYLPKFVGDELPKTFSGAVVSVADKIDTICGNFGIGVTPTSAGDPYGQRRQGAAVISIILNKKFRVSLKNLVQETIRHLGDKVELPADRVARDILEFLKGRFAFLMTQQKGLKQDTVDSVLALGFDDVVDAAQRVEALSVWRRRKDFNALANTFKRVIRIIEGQGKPGPVDKVLLSEPAESKLYKQARDVGATVERAVKAGKYKDALAELAKLGPTINAFFDEVLVMAEDQKVRANRISLLGQVAGLFSKLADFGQLQPA
jgi:glycyl-tRNA synthetase beta chain